MPITRKMIRRSIFSMRSEKLKRKTSGFSREASGVKR
jgi:hypothetical protein